MERGRRFARGDGPACDVLPYGSAALETFTTSLLNHLLFAYRARAS